MIVHEKIISRDMTFKILEPEVQRFINANLKQDLHSLLLKKSPFVDISMSEIATQIKGKQIAAKKLPFLLAKNIYFPPKLNLEQSSSEATARYKSTQLYGESFIDLTVGFGIDAFFISNHFKTTTLVERNLELLEIVEHNWKVLGKRANFINDDLHDVLQNLSQKISRDTEKFDVAFLDPARRDSKKQKVFLLEDLSPNILEILSQLAKITRLAVIKLSPLIDLSYLISVLPQLEKIEIVAVKNEVKEVLIFLNFEKITAKINCYCNNLESDEPSFEFEFADEQHAKTAYSEVLQYLYLPNNAILKAGAFNSLGARFHLKKLHPNTHLYTSDVLIKDFPGRVLKVESIDSKKICKNDYYNIVTKNYPLKPEEIKKKYKIKDGGTQYLIFTQSITSKIILRSQKF